MDYSIGDKVSLIIGRPTILGVQVYIGDDQVDGLLYHNEIFQPLELGRLLTAISRISAKTEKLT